LGSHFFSLSSLFHSISAYALWCFGTQEAACIQEKSAVMKQIVCGLEFLIWASSPGT